MEVTKRLNPGMRGTKRYFNRFGERLLYVRYRRDQNTQKCYTTVELIVDEQAIIPPIRNKNLFPLPTENVYVAIAYHTTTLRQTAKQAGAKWLGEQKCWVMRQRDAMKLGFKDRIVDIIDGQ